VTWSGQAFDLMDIATGNAERGMMAPSAL